MVLQDDVEAPAPMDSPPIETPSAAAPATIRGRRSSILTNQAAVIPPPQGQRQRTTSGYAPSYAESQFDTIIRRQRIRPQGALKIPAGHEKLFRIPSNSAREQQDSSPHSNGSGEEEHLPHVIHPWEFSGWGCMAHLESTSEEFDLAEKRRLEEERKRGVGAMGRWMATGVAGVAVAGSPFYAFPPVVAVAGVYSPISLLIAGLLLSFWRPIMSGLASALTTSGANYVYLLNGSTSKQLAVFGAVVTLLDDCLTSVVSAGTASSYLSQQGHLPFDDKWLTVMILVAMAALSLSGIRQVAGATCAILVFHLLCMFSMFVAGCVYWVKHGNETLRTNWVEGQLGNASAVAKSIFQGVCIAFLGSTGFETTPDYASQIRSGLYPSILRNLQLIALSVNAPIMLLTYALLPSREIVDNASVLNSVAERAAGVPLRVLMTVDAGLILCAGIFTGILSADALIDRMAVDRILPSILRFRMPVTHAPALSTSFFFTLCLVIFGSSGANLSVLSGVFAFTYLFSLFLFPISSLVLSYNRPRLPRTPTPSLLLTLLTIALSIVLIVGNSVLAPLTIGYFAIYLIVVYATFWAFSRRARCAKVAWWVLDRWKWTKGLAGRIVETMLKMKGRAVVVFVETDEVGILFERLQYVRENEETSCVKLVHCYRSIENIPSELEANFKILDEALPSITVDLIFVQGNFSPSLVNVVADRLGVSRQLCFMGCPGSSFPYTTDDFADVRIIGA
ncbi:hypothetical protein T439DRAFT_305359 [Meredithblackwellia eburnea MCA 4105]